jgi:leader peptidase (prepilin peptidase)/N-methyltransferase
MSGAAVVVSGVAGLIVGVVMTSPVNSYLATLRTEGIAARPAVPWAVAIATGLTFVAGAAAADDGWHAVPLLVAATGLAAVSATDVRSYRIADRILFPSITATLLAMIVVAVGPGQFGDLWRALVAGAVFSGLLLLVALIAAAGGLGLGDVKLAILLGMVVGWSAGSNDDVARLLMYAMLLSSLLGVFNGLFLAMARRLTGKHLLPDPDADPDAPLPPLLKTAFPFGPGLVAGTLIVIAFRDALV